VRAVAGVAHLHVCVLPAQGTQLSLTSLPPARRGGRREALRHPRPPAQKGFDFPIHPGIAFLAHVLALVVSVGEEHPQQVVLIGRARVLRPLFPGGPIVLMACVQGVRAHASLGCGLTRMEQPCTCRWADGPPSSSVRRHGEREDVRTDVAARRDQGCAAERLQIGRAPHAE
jgi:hypothetical protein